MGPLEAGGILFLQLPATESAGGYHNLVAYPC